MMEIVNVKDDTLLYIHVVCALPHKGGCIFDEYVGLITRLRQTAKLMLCIYLISPRY